MIKFCFTLNSVNTFLLWYATIVCMFSGKVFLICFFFFVIIFLRYFPEYGKISWILLGVSLISAVLFLLWLSLNSCCPILFLIHIGQSLTSWHAFGGYFISSFTKLSSEQINFARLIRFLSVTIFHSVGACSFQWVLLKPLTHRPTDRPSSTYVKTEDQISNMFCNFEFLKIFIMN